MCTDILYGYKWANVQNLTKIPLSRFIFCKHLQAIMKKKNWDKRIADLKNWIENQSDSDNMNAILLSITLGNNANSDDLRTTYWRAIRSIGQTMNDFPTKYMPKQRKPREMYGELEDGYLAPTSRDGGLRSRFRSELRGVKSGIRDTGRVIYKEKTPSLENLRIECIVCQNEYGSSQEKTIRKICHNYGITEENIHIFYKDCSHKPKGRPSRYERTGRSGSYHGGNRWEPGNW